MVAIEHVVSGSIGAELEIAAGDLLHEVNGQQVEDCLDARFLLAEEEVTLRIEKSTGELWELEVEKELADDLGLVFAHPQPATCGNKCVFCFVHQLPRGLRSTLYVMDEDYRFSFLYGAYVTLSNLRERDIERIIARRLSPLYVSVHATNPELRSRLLGRRTAPLLPLLRRLVAGRVELHAQIVVCPGWNDGPELLRSITELYALGDGVRSLAIVPVGLTGHRRGLPPLRTPLPEEAAEVLDRIDPFQEQALRERGTRWVFAADEWYLRAGRQFPPGRHYEDFPQLENGVGLVADFRERARRLLARVKSEIPLHLTTVTGVSFATELRGFLDRLRERTGASVTPVAIENRLFGGEVSVAGLVCGQDLVAQLKGRELGTALLVPDVMLKDGSEMFLDDLTLEDVAVALGVRVVKIAANPAGLWRGIRRVAEAEQRKRRSSR